MIKFGDLSLNFSLKESLSLKSMKFLSESTNASINSQLKSV